MKVLFIGGTGVISSACSQLAVERGIDLYLLNRGQSQCPVPSSARVLLGDIRDKGSVNRILDKMTFDVVVDWVAFTPAHVEVDLELFRQRTKQYVFISSASAYQKPPASLPITESTPLSNPFWKYSQDKIACEQLLMRSFDRDGLPVTIVRPSHTYDQTSLPIDGGYTVLNRMRQGKKVIVHGDGSSLWTLTHHRDFAKGFVPLLGNSRAIGQAYHITSDELLTWNQIFETLAAAAGTKPRIVHVPSDTIASFDPNWGAGLLGDKAHSVIFDNSKIKSIAPDFAATIPFADGAKEIISWFDSNPSHRLVNEQTDQMIDKIIAACESIRLCQTQPTID
ncbi:MAG: NAD-dependent epimerase/dehydratase family protein [Phycisphaerae bacterium]